MTCKSIAKPIAKIIWKKEDGTDCELGVLFEWNTGETQLRWSICPSQFSQGLVVRQPLSNGAGTTSVIGPDMAAQDG